MAYISPWRRVAGEIILGVLNDKAITWESKLSEIDKRYPFGERAYTPYKIWLKIRRDAKKRIDLVLKTTKAVKWPD